MSRGDYCGSGRQKQIDDGSLSFTALDRQPVRDAEMTADPLPYVLQPDGMMAAFLRFSGNFLQTFAIETFKYCGTDTVSVVCNENVKTVFPGLAADTDVAICFPAAKTVLNAVFHERLQEKGGNLHFQIIGGDISPGNGYPVSSYSV